MNLSQLNYKLKTLKETMDKSLDIRVIYERLNPKYKEDIFKLHNQLISILDHSYVYDDNQLIYDLMYDWYLTYFKIKGGIRPKYVMKETIFEKYNNK